MNETTDLRGAGLTLQQARAALKAHPGWISWDDEHDIPWVDDGEVSVDGCFTADQLRALLWFVENNPTRAPVHA